MIWSKKTDILGWGQKSPAEVNSGHYFFGEGRCVCVCVCQELEAARINYLLFALWSALSNINRSTPGFLSVTIYLE